MSLGSGCFKLLRWNLVFLKRQFGRYNLLVFQTYLPSLEIILFIPFIIKDYSFVYLLLKLIKNSPTLNVLKTHSYK